MYHGVPSSSVSKAYESSCGSSALPSAVRYSSSGSSGIAEDDGEDVSERATRDGVDTATEDRGESI